MFTIELKRNHDHVSAAEFKKTYEVEYHKDLIKNEINKAVTEYGTYCEGYLDDFILNDINNLKQLVKGSYSLNCGDYTYWIEIDNSKSIS